jgi:hypothetical protein
MSHELAADIEATPEEQRAINALKRLAKKWPRSLWLYSAAGTLCVMQADENGEHRTGGGASANDGMDPDYCLETINIPNDGGDW